MATFLDITGLEQFSSFFVFIFVWLAVYALLMYSKVIQSHAINIVIGLIIALFVLFSPVATGAIRFIAPWFAIILIFLMLITVLINSFGAGDIASYSHLRGIFLVVILGILIIGFLSFIREQTVVPGDNETIDKEDIDFTKTTNVIFHPKILGMIFILLVAIFTIALLAGKAW